LAPFSPAGSFWQPEIAVFYSCPLSYILALAGHRADPATLLWSIVITLHWSLKKDKDLKNPLPPIIYLELRMQ
jgi:hypothetical protein